MSAYVAVSPATDGATGAAPCSDHANDSDDDRATDARSPLVDDPPILADTDGDGESDDDGESTALAELVGVAEAKGDGDDVGEADGSSSCETTPADCACVPGTPLNEVVNAFAASLSRPAPVCTSAVLICCHLPSAFLKFTAVCETCLVIDPSALSNTAMSALERAVSNLLVFALKPTNACPAAPCFAAPGLAR
jgi:hypothetical protein